MCVQTQRSSEEAASSEETFDSRKKPSDLWKKPSNLQQELRRKHILEKRSECRRLDAYRSCVQNSQLVSSKGLLAQDHRAHSV